MNIARNELCPCGSGKKYKKCCINKDIELQGIEELIEQKLSSMTEEELMMEFYTNFRKLLLDREPTIKEYKKIRKIHGEITDSMARDIELGKFKLEVTNPKTSIKENMESVKNGKAHLFDSFFDMNTQVGAQGFVNLMIYKNSVTTKCLAEVYLEKNKFRKPEKIEFLKSMKEAHAGLFEVLKIEQEKGLVHLKDLLSNQKYCITDIGLSGSLNYEQFYNYMRIITYKGISFGTGLNLIFKKDDTFIRTWIKENKEKYNPKEETVRFIELYNRYSKNDNGVRLKVNSF